MTTFLLGDSWAHTSLSNLIHPTMCVSRHPGCTAAKIAGRAWIGRGLDYVVIVAGVNDRVRHVGAKRYADGVQMLADSAWNAAAVPVVVELPRIDESRVKATLLQRVWRWIARWLHDGVMRTRPKPIGPNCAEGDCLSSFRSPTCPPNVGGMVAT